MVVVVGVELRSSGVESFWRAGVGVVNSSGARVGVTRFSEVEVGLTSKTYKGHLTDQNHKLDRRSINQQN